MLKYFKKRMGEPSSWAGIGILTMGLGTLLKANGVPEAGEAIANSAADLAAGNYAAPIIMVVSGLLAALKPDKN